MSVRVNKSSFNIREKLSELERPIGLKGSELMRSETVQDARDLVSAGRKNFIINGGFDVWQRGTTVTAAGYTADRFMAYSTNTNVANYGVKVTRQQDSPIGLNGYCAEIALSNTSGGIDKVTFGQRIEAINFYGLKSGTIMTLSFYLKRIQNANSDLTLYIKSAQNGVDSYTNPTVNQNSYDVTVKTESLGSFNTIPTIWTKYSFTFAVTDALITNGGSFYIQNGNTDLGVTNTNALYRTTGWQLEVGKNATEFEHRSYGEELALCQRYYQKSYPTEVTPGTNVSASLGFAGMEGRTGMSNVSSTGEHFRGTKLFPSMRTTPNITIYDRVGNSGKITGTKYLTADYDNITASVQNVCATGFQAKCINVGDFGGISFHYTANAEL